MRDERSNKEDVESAGSSYEEVFVVYRPSIMNEARSTGESKTAEASLPPYNPHQLVCSCDEEMVYMYIARRWVRRRVIAAEMRQTLKRLLKMEATLKRNEKSDALAACKHIKDVKVKKERKDDGDSDTSVVFVKSTRAPRS